MFGQIECELTNGDQTYVNGIAVAAGYRFRVEIVL